jgi:hypothetical protein
MKNDLILWLATITALIILITKTIEMVTLIQKYRAENKSKTEPAPSLKPIPPRLIRSAAFILLTDILVLPIAFIALWLIAQRPTPPTNNDIVTITICVGAILIVGQRRTPEL